MATEKLTKIVVYRLIDLKKNPETGKFKAPILLNIPTKDTILVNGKQKVIKYSPGTLVTSDNQIADIKTQIVFTNGHLLVKPHQIDLHNYLEQCNWNRSNPNRIEDVVPIFEKVDEGKNKREALGDLNVRDDAVKIIREMDFEEQYACALALHINVQQDAMAIEHDLRRHAETDASWFIENSLEDLKIKAKFLKAIEIGIVKVDGRSRIFSWGGEMSDGKPIVKVPAGIEDIVGWFLDWCMDNQENGVYGEIMEQIGKHMKKNDGKLSEIKEAVA